MTGRAGWLVALSLAALTPALGQGISGPHIGYVYPAGGKQGSVVRVTVGGQQLRGTDGAHLSGPGVRTEVIQYIRPLGENELGDAGWYLANLVRRRWSARTIDYLRKSEDPPLLADHPWLRGLDHKTPDELARLRARLFNPKQQLNPQIADQVEVDITIAPDALPGDRELRLLTPGGLTNPVRFQVGTLPEVLEGALSGPEDSNANVLDLPTAINGQIVPGDTDRFWLRARRGQQLVFRLQARHFVPYIADAVPGWFQAVVVLRDPQGREVAHADDYRFDPDPTLLYSVPADGDYSLEVRDSIYRGRDDFVYRVLVGELPFITSLFPLGAPEGTSVTASLSGWNLPAKTLTLDTAPGGSAVRQATLPDSRGLANSVSYAVGALPELAESEPNDAPEKSEALALPAVVNGRIGQPDDLDTFRFSGKAGDDLVIEVRARRLGSPLDSAVRLTDATGKVLAANDDYEDPESGLLTHHADSYLQFRLPTDGEYRVMLSDAQSHGGEAYGYRLRVGPPQPDFAVRLTPSGVNLTAGRSANVTAHAVRKDGFAGAIEVVAKAVPAEFVVSTARIEAGKDTASVRITAPPQVTPGGFALHLEARAQIGDRQVSHPVVAAEDMMQAFAYRHLVPQQEFLVAVPGRRRIPAVWSPLVEGVQLATDATTRLPLDGTAEVFVKAPQTLSDRAQSPLQSLRFTTAAALRGITLQSSRPVSGGIMLTLEADGNLARVGDAGSVLVGVSAPAEGVAKSLTGAQFGQRVFLGVLPPIPFEVVLP